MPSSEPSFSDSFADNLTLAHRVFPVPPEDLSISALWAACDGLSGLWQEAGWPERGWTAAWGHRMKVCRHAREMSRTPLVGVCGTVNSGKSTVVASMLSEAQRGRVLIGELGMEGTHRFVFWLPSAWRENGIGAELEEMIGAVAGCRPELLADDPEDAAAQYNARHDRVKEFPIPLLAYDPGLDAEGIGFLDCPDIQRSLDETRVEFTSGERLKILRAMAPMCSAFLVVSSMQQLGTETSGQVFSAVTDAAPAAPLYFVLNMTRSDDVGVYRTEAESALRRWGVDEAVRRIYLAPFVKREQAGAPVWPDFRSADEARVPLRELRSELEPADLQRRHLESSLKNLRAVPTEAQRLLDTRSARICETVREVHGKVGYFLEGKFISRDGELRALCFNEAARQMNESIQRTAPWAVRVAQAPVTWFRGMVQSFKKRNATDEDASRYAQIKDGDFANAMLGHRGLPPATTREELTAVWQAAYTAVVNDTPGGFDDPEELDRLTREMWSQLPSGKKMTLYRNIALSLAAFAVAGALVPLDGGATIVVMSKFHMVLGGWEILAVAVGGPLAGMLASLPSAQALVKQLEAEVAKPQVSALYAGLVDGLGVPRYLDEAPVLRVPKRESVVLHRLESPPQPVIVRTLAEPWIVPDAPGFQKLQQYLAS